MYIFCATYETGAAVKLWQIFTARWAEDYNGWEIYECKAA
jgi:hypothetical protein